VRDDRALFKPCACVAPWEQAALRRCRCTLGFAIVAILFMCQLNCTMAVLDSACPPKMGPVTSVGAVFVPTRGCAVLTMATAWPSFS
jgi:hypothetical protein